VSRIGLLSDVHADASSLGDALRWCRELGCSELLCAGDLVDFGAEPDEMVARLVEARVGCVRGNHDRWALERARQPLLFGSLDGGLEPEPTPLSERVLGFLEGLPAMLHTSHDGLHVLVCHARPRSDMDGIYAHEPSSATLLDWLLDAEAQVLFVGHTHEPLVRPLPDGRLVVNPGTALREAGDGIPPRFVLDRETGQFVEEERLMGTFAVLDTHSLEVELRRTLDGTRVGSRGG
jgi:predicted phosphodiesterase